MSPLLNNSKVSKLKVEKVLIPPQNPTSKSIRNEEVYISFWRQNTNTPANIAQLIRFALRVAIGSVIPG